MQGQNSSLSSKIRRIDEDENFVEHLKPKLYKIASKSQLHMSAWIRLYRGSSHEHRVKLFFVVFIKRTSLNRHAPVVRATHGFNISCLIRFCTLRWRASGMNLSYQKLTIQFNLESWSFPSAQNVKHAVIPLQSSALRKHKSRKHKNPVDIPNEADTTTC